MLGAREENVLKHENVIIFYGKKYNVDCICYL